MSAAPLRIMILAPTVLPAPTGNAATAERWRRGLVARGHEVLVMASTGLTQKAFLQAMATFRPQILHVHQLLRSACLLIDNGRCPLYGPAALFLSPAGTDVYGTDGQGCREEDVELIKHLCGLAQGIIVPGPALAHRLHVLAPETVVKTRVVPKGVFWAGDAPCDVRARCGWGADTLVFFLPAGIRPVKGNLLCLRAFRRVAAHRPQVRICFAGPVIDVAYGDAFAEELSRAGAFARLLPPLPREQMRAAYASVDVVVNASLAEGLSNALLEAVAAGRPILAADIPGNRTVLGENALFFPPGDEEQCAAQLLRLVDEPALRTHLSQAARALAAHLPSPAQEAALLEACYWEGRTGRG
ncbi:MAG: glycosyltransferase family 4 protein [Syntrophales bacterium]|nr:glycosyltransferase family 4 protein [Syntrophales bacterium]